MVKKMQILDWIPKNLTHIRLQIILTLCSTAILTFLFHSSLNKLQFFDEKPMLLSLPTESLRDTNRLPSIIETGMLIRNFPEFDVTRNKFTADMVLWFIFNPALISLDVVDQFSFVKGTIKYKSDPETRAKRDGIEVRYEMLVEFTSGLDYRMFPLDDHSIFFTLTNRTISPSDAIFESSKQNFSIDSDMLAGGFRLLDHDVQYGYLRSQLERQNEKSSIENPCVVFSLKIGKPGIRRTLLIMIPIALLFFMALFSLSLYTKEYKGSILALSIGSLTSLLSYRFVIEHLSPSVGYFTFGDYIYTFALLCVFLIFLFNAFFTEETKKNVQLDHVKLVLLIFFHVSFILFVYYFIFYWK